MNIVEESMYEFVNLNYASEKTRVKRFTVLNFPVLCFPHFFGSKCIFGCLETSKSSIHSSTVSVTLGILEQLKWISMFVCSFVSSLTEDQVSLAQSSGHVLVQSFD